MKNNKHKSGPKILNMISFVGVFVLAGVVYSQHTILKDISKKVDILTIKLHNTSVDLNSFQNQNISPMDIPAFSDNNELSLENFDRQVTEEDNQEVAEIPSLPVKKELTEEEKLDIQLAEFNRAAEEEVIRLNAAAEAEAKRTEDELYAEIAKQEAVGDIEEHVEYSEESEVDIINNKMFDKLSAWEGIPPRVRDARLKDLD